MIITCSRCRATWTGMNTAHCGSCCETFLGVAAFDYHRRGSTCTSPQSLTKVVDGVRHPAPLVLAGDVWAPPHPTTGAAGRYVPRGYEAWTFPDGAA